MRSYGLRRTLQSELSWRKRQSKIYRSNQQQTQTRSPHLSSSFAVKEAAAADVGAAAVCGGGSLPICRWGGSRTCFVLCFQLAAACPPFFICRNENNFLCRGCFHPFLNWVSVRRGMLARGGVGGHPMRDINYSDPRNISVYVDYFQDLLP